jgi:glycerophosphoryl diester phosphodiesterase
MPIDRRRCLASLCCLPLLGMARVTQPPLVFAHRGASALRPEHTLAAYGKAIADGADYVEPDLVATRDGVLVARHENDLTGTTDVAQRPEYADRRRTATIDGQAHDGWFSEDFTLAELKTLRAIERLPAIRPDNRHYDGRFDVPTWDEIVAFVAAEAKAAGRTIGLVPELKHSTYFAALGLPLEPRFLASLAHPYLQHAPLIVQSFEVGNLQALRQHFGDRGNWRLLQLFDDPSARPADAVAAGQATRYADMATAEGLRAVAAYADIAGPHKSIILADGEPGPSRFVADSHAAGLQVMPYTFRPENVHLPAGLRGEGGPAARHDEGAIAEIRRYLDAGIDGFFTDDPAIGRRAVDGWRG